MGFSSLLQLGADVVNAAFSETVPGCCRFSRIEIFLIDAKALRTLEMHALADEIAGVRRSVHGHAVLLLRSQGVDLLHPEAGHFP